MEESRSHPPAATSDESRPRICSEFIKFPKERFIVRRKAITACYHIPADENNPQPATVVFFDNFSQTVTDPQMNVYLWIELVLLKPDIATVPQ